jgi:hypothetical protein
MIRLPVIAALGLLAAAACAPIETAPPAAGEPIGQCPAAKYRPYIGQNRSQLPAAAPGEVRRVVCDTCAVTMDYNAVRVNVIYDTDTNVVKEVTCG